jgi:hypothetical protein
MADTVRHSDRAKGRAVTVGGGLLACALVLSGCVGGTTYGTGVSQEEQTINDLYNMLSLRTPKKAIDYSARPDLIVPEDKADLPEPVDTAATTANPQWPETPEERIARVREQAGEIDPRTGDYSLQEQLRPKEGIGIEGVHGQNKRIAGVTDRDGIPVLYRGESEARQDVIRAKSDLNLSSGQTRKYLTEPPVAYRQPADTAASGEQAYSPEEIAAREEEERRLLAAKNAELAGRK